MRPGTEGLGRLIEMLAQCPFENWVLVDTLKRFEILELCSDNAAGTIGGPGPVGSGSPAPPPSGHESAEVGQR